ncbi:hypothetical protein HNE_0856 [Hyphomonas neptunium ATCC 15444]|uniref:Uncharacterized protein n=2 Tax=Hyphomonas TaxID=85 RepID=Q0C3W0_HYPNA|nr:MULTISPECIES: hypothetical protein [Hyphomonas]ABI78152.1 hypothetical protein HNE_0856 [Hyphomonas neptunium ATCC 15444]KCZ96206.1 hypothetical protein HHI_00965 [Hyphomonas hirschiana VP5]
MIDILHQFTTGSGFPVVVLVCCAIIVVIEAAKASRRALWGDLFTEDFDE